MGKFLKITFLFVLVFAFSTFVYKSYTFAEDAQVTTTSVTTSETIAPSDDTEAAMSPVPISAAKITLPRNGKMALQQAKARNLEIKKELDARKLEAKTKKVEKLAENRLKICEEKSTKIKARLNSSFTLGQANHKRLQEVVILVDKFYTEKLVTNGQVVSNYADLKAEIAVNETNVQTLLASLKASADAFDCNSADPKGELENFRADVKSLIEAEKTYKESVHVFVKAVLASAKLSVSPEPSVIKTGGEQ